MRVMRVNPNPTRLIADHEYLTHDRPAYQTSQVKWVIHGLGRFGRSSHILQPLFRTKSCVSGSSKEISQQSLRKCSKYTASHAIHD